MSSQVTAGFRDAAGSGGQAAARARWAVTALFGVFGLVVASYFVRIPALKSGHRLSDGQLGLVLTMASVAALVAMQFAGVLTARFGSRWVARLSAVALPLSLLAVGTAHGLAELVLALVVYGGLGGVLDIAMNSQAIAVEQALRRPVINGCHAAWSIGAIVGSFLGELAAKSGWSLTRHYLWLAPAVALFAAVTGRWALAAPVSPGGSPAARARSAGRWRAGWTRRVLVFGALGAAVMLCEGTVAAWSGVFLHDNRGAVLATAALGYVAFTVCEAAGRLTGDRLQRRYGASALVRTSAVIAIAGLALALSPSATLGIIGFGILGIGLSVLLPVIFSAVGHGSAAGGGAASVAAALSRFTTMSYSGILIGPILVGWLAELIGLTPTLAGMELLLLAVVLTARLVAAADQPESPESPAS